MERAAKTACFSCSFVMSFSVEVNGTPILEGTDAFVYSRLPICTRRHLRTRSAARSTASPPLSRFHLRPFFRTFLPGIRGEARVGCHNRRTRSDSGSRLLIG